MGRFLCAFSEELLDGMMLLKIETFQDLYFALKSRKELKESTNPEFSKLRDTIREQIESLVE